MAKLKAPLLSMGASGQFGKTIVYAPWKGLKIARSYVIPANPNSPAQQTQRGYVQAAVTTIHEALADLTKPITDTDKSAYALWASVLGIIMTWFNAAIRCFIIQNRATLDGVIYGGGESTPGDGSLGVELYAYGTEMPTAGTIFYGTSKSAMLQQEAAGVTTNEITASLTGLVNGTVYYWQFRPTVPSSVIGAFSGIYHGTPTA